MSQSTPQAQPCETRHCSLVSKNVVIGNDDDDDDDDEEEEAFFGWAGLWGQDWQLQHPVDGTTGVTLEDAVLTQPPIERRVLDEDEASKMDSSIFVEEMEASEPVSIESGGRNWIRRAIGPVFVAQR